MHTASILLLLIVIASPVTTPDPTPISTPKHDPDAKIAALTRRIAKNPRNPWLYLSRGETYRQTGKLRHAMADYTRTLELDRALHFAHMGRAAVFLETGKPARALAATDKFLTGARHNPFATGEALWIRGRALRQLGRCKAATEAFDAAIDHIRTLQPVHFLERVDVHRGAGRTGKERALAILDDGLRRLGPLVALAETAVELELELGNHEAALRRLDAIIATVRRPAHWLRERARILERLGRTAAARAARRRADLDPLQTPKPSGALKLGPPAALRKPVRTTLIPAGAKWRYLDDGSDQKAAWRTPQFDDSKWQSGPAQLGYGDGDEKTVLSYGTNPDDKHITAYFRHSFTIADLSKLKRICLRLLRDDGAVVYLNGKEMVRHNLPSSTITFDTKAKATTDGAGEHAFHYRDIPSRFFVKGTNVLAVEVHQVEPTSSDMSFDLELFNTDDTCLVRGPYLQRGAPTSATLRWRTDVAKESVVWLGTKAGQLSLAKRDSNATKEHAVTVTGLKPDTRYYYAIGHGSLALAGDDTAHWFRTAPSTGTNKKTRVWVIGDSGTANRDAAAVRDAYAQHGKGTPTDVWLMLGDNAYNLGTDTEYQAAVFDTYPKLLRNAFLWPTLGNHDAASASSVMESGVYYDIFSLPRKAESGGLASGTEAYYSFDWGNIHFICLNTAVDGTALAAAMVKWLKADLANTRARWLVAFFHHPPYSKGSHDSDNDQDSEGRLAAVRTLVLPVLESGGVDLVLTGHSHSYERSFLLDQHYGKSTTLKPKMIKDGGDGRAASDGIYAKPCLGPAKNEGAVYIVAGSSGRVTDATLDHPAMAVSLARLGSLILDVDRDRLDARFLDEKGQTLDTFTVRKGLRRTLTRDVPRISISKGGAQTLKLDATTTQANRSYIVAGSLATSPGQKIGSVLLPLNAGPWFQLSLVWANSTVLENTLGKLDAAGKATAKLRVPVSNQTNLIGLSFYFAYLVYDNQGPRMASNTVRLTLTR